MRTLWIIILILAIIAVVVYFWRDRSGTGMSETAYCTLDAKLCPDGSYVGRVPPDCQFAACPVSTSTGPSLESDADLNVNLQSKL